MSGKAGKAAAAPFRGDTPPSRGRAPGPQGPEPPDALGATGTPASPSASRPVLAGRTVTLRPGCPGDAELLHAILAEPSVSRWWGEPGPAEEIEAALRSDGPTVLLVVEIDGEVAGGIQYGEEDDPQYRHAGIDVYLAGRFQGRGAGTEAVTLLAGFLFQVRGHHRLTIDPAAANTQAIRCYTKAGFRPVGVMRAYERGPDGRFHDGLLMDMLAAELGCGL